MPSNDLVILNFMEKHHKYIYARAPEGTWHAMTITDDEEYRGKTLRHCVSNIIKGKKYVKK